MPDSSHPLRRADVETYVLPDGTTLLFDPRSESGLPLDVLSSLIWDYCDGALSEEDIVAEVVALLPQLDGVEPHVRSVIAGFAEEDLLMRPAQVPGAS